MDPVDLEVAPTLDGLLSFEVVGDSAERVEFLMTYEDAALLHTRLGELLSATNLSTAPRAISATALTLREGGSAFKPAATIIGESNLSSRH